MSGELSEGARIIARAKEIRAKLMAPNGIVDEGIDLQRRKHELREQVVVKKVLSPPPPPPKPKPIQSSLPMVNIIRAVGAHFGVPPRMLVSKNRTAKVVLPRQIAFHLCRQLIGYSYPKIGAFFKKDHTTVIYADFKIRRLIEDGPLSISNHVKAVRLIYERDYYRPPVSTKPQQDMAVQLRVQECSSEFGIRGVEEGKPLDVDSSETSIVPNGHWGILRDDPSGEAGQAQA